MHLTSVSLSLSLAAPLSAFLVASPSPLLDSSFSLIDEPLATTNRSFQPSIHLSLLSLFTRLFHRKLHSRGFLSIPIIVIRTNDRNGENIRLKSIVVFLFFSRFWMLDFSRIIFSFVKKHCVSSYFLKQSTVSIFLGKLRNRFPTDRPRNIRTRSIVTDTFPDII